LEGSIVGLFGFGRKKSAPVEVDRGHEAVLRLLAEKERQGDDITRLQVAGSALFSGLYRMMAQPERGARIDDILGVLGATGGFACIVGALHLAGQSDSAGEQGLVIANGADGRQYYFGDLPNRLLLEDRLSLVSLTLGAAQKAGAAVSMDSAIEVVKRTASAVGGSNFGITSLPEEHRPGDSFEEYVRHLWPRVREALDLYAVRPECRASAIGFAIQNAIDAGKAVLDPAMAAQIVVEYGIPAAKLDPLEFEAAQ
jgi:hypothetical protein